MDKNFKVKVNDSLSYNFNTSDIQELNVLSLPKSKFHIINNNKSFNVTLEESNFLDKEYVVNVNLNRYTIKISTELDVLIKQLGFSVGSSKKANDIKAPMPGLIINILVKTGQKVNEGDQLLILEAMKMENSISSPKEGIVKSIFVKSGETVEKGALMIELE